MHYSFGVRTASSMRSHGCSWELVWVVIWDVDHMLFANTMFCRKVWDLMLNEPGMNDVRVERTLRRSPFSDCVVNRAKGM